MCSSPIRAMYLVVVGGMIVLLEIDGMCIDYKGWVTILGNGTVSCGGFIQRRDEYAFFTTWVEGYLTAVNMRTSDTINILRNTDIHGAMLWLENYCKNNPLENFNKAVYYLVEELYQYRLTKPPIDNTKIK